MGYNITAGQQALMDYGMAQAEAISGRTEVTFELGKQSIKERIILEDEIESIEKLSRLAQQKARDRKRKGGFGGLGGFVGATLLSLAIPGSTAGLKALKVLLPGLGKQAGKALAGGFKDVKVGDLDRDVQDKLILSKTKGRKIEEAYDDFEAALDELNDRQKQQAFMEFGLDAIMGTSMLKYENLAVGSGETLGELRAMGKEGIIDYGFKDYLKDIANISILGGKGSDSTQALLEGLDMQASSASVNASLMETIEEFIRQNRPKVPEIATPAADAFEAAQLAEDARRTNVLSDMMIESRSRQTGVQPVEVIGQRGAFDFSTILDESLFGRDTLNMLSDAYEKVSPEFRRQFPGQLNPESFAGDFLAGRVGAGGRATTSEFVAKDLEKNLANRLMNTPFDQLSKDAQAYKLALDPTINEELAKSIYESRGLGQFSSASKVEAAFRADNPTFTGAFNRNTVAWDDIKKYIAEAESSNNPLAVNINSKGSIDFGLYQINSKFLNRNLANFATSVIDQRPDVVYQDVQDILGSFGAVRQGNSLFNLGSL